MFLGIITISSCNKKSTKSDTGYTEVQIPESLIQSNNLKSTSDTIPKDERVVKEPFVLYEGDTVALTGTQIITMDKYGNLIKLEISNNIFNNSKLTPDFLQKYYDEVSSQKSSGLKTTKSIEGISGCYDQCKKDYKKHQGRGWCKAGCWGNFIIKAAATAAALIAATS